MSKMDKITRRVLLGSMAGSTLMSGFPAIAKNKTINWTLISPFPQSDPTTDRLVGFAKEVEGVTEGALKIRVLLAGQHPYEYRDGIDIVRDGIVELTHTGTNYLTAVQYWFSITIVPFLIDFDRNNTEKQHKFSRKWHKEIVDPFLLKNYNVKTMSVFMDSGGWGNAIHTPVRLEDFNSLKGLKIRAHDRNTSELAKILGASPATVPYSELYLAVQRGSIDGVMTSLVGAKAQNLWELLQFTNIYDPMFGVDFIGVNVSKWDKLPEDIREAVRPLFDKWFNMDVMFKFHSQINESIIAEAKNKHDAQFDLLTGEFRKQLIEECGPIKTMYLDDAGEFGKRSMELAESI